VKSVWKELGFNGDPINGDILYMPIADQFFSVSDVTPIKNIGNRVYVYELTLSIVTNNFSTAIQDNLIDMSELIETSDVFTGDNEEEAVIIEVDPPFDYGLQRLSKTELIQIGELHGFMYGIIYHNDTWLKYKRSGNVQLLRTLQGVTVNEPELLDNVRAAKFIQVNNEFSVIDESMYYTSINLPSQFQPLQLIEHVTRKPRD
jgi:hypothetical protein